MHISLDHRGIQVLDFSSHHAESADPKDVVALQVIESVDASHNKIRALLHISVFTSLRVLDLSHNRLASPVLEWLRALPEGLEELNVSHNEIATLESARGEQSSIGHTFGTYTPRLRKLNISHNILHASASVEAPQTNAAAGTAGSCRIEELILDHNTGLFSLNELLAGLPQLTSLSCIGNHVASLEGIAALAVSSPALTSVSFASCAVSDRLQEESFLWNVIGGSIFQYKNAAEQKQAQRDMGKLSEFFFAVFVSQVLPSVRTVDTVSVAEALDLVGPLIHSGPKEGGDHDDAWDDDEPVHVAAKVNVSGLSAAAPTVAETEAPDDYDDSSSEHSSGDRTPPRAAHAGHPHDNNSPMSPSRVPSASEAAQRYGEVMSGYQPNLTATGGHAVRSRSAPQHVLERIDFLHKRAVELQEFIAASQKHTRHFESLGIQASNTLKQRRQEVAEQRVELAALRVERSSQKEMIRNLQHLIQKKTRELDHAEVANIRVVEKKISTLIHEKENALRSQAAKKTRDKLRNQSSSGADAAALSRKPTRSSIHQLEETQRRLRSLKESSPTAATGARFVYNEFGNPELAGDQLDGERYPRSAHLHDGGNISPQVATRELHFTANLSSFDESPRRRSSVAQRPVEDRPEELRLSTAAREIARRPSHPAAVTSTPESFISGTTKVSLSPERSLTRERSRSTPNGAHVPTATGNAFKNAPRAKSLLTTEHVYSMPPRSPKTKRLAEPDHNNTSFASHTTEEVVAVEQSIISRDASAHPPSDSHSGLEGDAESSALSNFRFPVDRRKSSALGDPHSNSMSGAGRRQSVAPEESPKRRQSASARTHGFDAPTDARRSLGFEDRLQSTTHARLSVPDDSPTRRPSHADHASALQEDVADASLASRRSEVTQPARRQSSVRYDELLGSHIEARRRSSIHRHIGSDDSSEQHDTPFVADAHGSSTVGEHRQGAVQRRQSTNDESPIRRQSTLSQLRDTNDPRNSSQHVERGEASRSREGRQQSVSSVRRPSDSILRRQSASAPAGEGDSLSILQRRSSNLAPLDVEQMPYSVPWSDGSPSDDDGENIAQQLVERIVATTERRSTVTGHGYDGQLANPISTLEELASSPSDPPLSSSSLPHQFHSGASNRRESRILTGTTTQQSFHDFAEGSAVSIALQSPKKRISESSADATRRKPSDIIIERAMREAQALNYSLTSGDSDASRADRDVSEHRRVMVTSDGMCAVPRATHVASRGTLHSDVAPPSTGTTRLHRYDIHQTFSLDQSISRVKPDFRRNTTL